MSRSRSTATAFWGAFGAIAIIGQAIYRLAPLALEPIRQDLLSGWLWAAYGASILIMAYSEGYRGFQRAWSPRVVARAFYLADNPRPLLVALAPLFCMGFFHATRKRLIVTWALVVGIVVLVLAVHRLDQPWRGIIDAGVVVGLGWGLISVAVFFFRALAGHTPPVPPDVPHSATRE